MKRGKCFLIGILAVILFGCTKAPTPQTHPPMDTSRVFNANYDKTWGALISALSTRGIPIQSSDKASGLLQFQQAEQSAFVGVEKTIDHYTYRPTRILAVWKALTTFVSVNVTKESENQTRISINAVFRGYNNLIGWEVLPTRGTLEWGLLNLIEGRL